MNGDWRKENCIQYYKSAPGALEDNDLIYQKVVATILEVYVSSRPLVFPRHRWTGSDVSIDWIGAMESCHSLFSMVYTKFLSLLAGVACHQSPLGDRDAQASLGAPPAIDVEAEPYGHQEQDYVEFGASHAHQEDNTASDYAAQMAKDRKLSKAWLETKPFGNLMIIRTVIQPLLELLYSQFELNSPEWEIAEQAKATVVDDTPVQHITPNRQYKVTIAASQVLEEKFFSKLSHLLSCKDHWKYLPLEKFTTKTRCTILKLLSKAGCAVHQVYADPHTHFPVAMFNMLQQPLLARELRSKPSCVKDSWSKKMTDIHQNWFSELFKLELTLQASLLSTDITQIEARHASVRRQLVMRSTQVKTMTMNSLGSEWVFQQVRRLKSSLAKKCVKPAAKAALSLKLYSIPPNMNLPSILFNSVHCLD
eukprot:6487089-Amphidinium_carterae.2